MESSLQEPKAPSAVGGMAPPVATPSPDRTTIGRLLLLTAGVAIALGIFLPEIQKERGNFFAKQDGWLLVCTALLSGLSLPAPLFTVRWRRRQPLGPGGLFALTCGLGALLLLIPLEISNLAQVKGSLAPQVDGSLAPMCLAYCLPLMGTWYLLAAALGGQIGRHLLRSETPWVERYGFLLAGLWTPWGIWHLAQIYWTAF